MPATTLYAVIMLLAGIGVPMLAAMNAQLGTRLGSPVAAAMFLFVVAFVCATVVLVFFDKPSALFKASTAPKYLFLGGFLIAFYLLSITYIAPHFGLGNAVFAVLLGQLISAAAIDHFGLFGAQITPITWTRVFGLTLMAAGVFLTQQGK